MGEILWCLSAGYLSRICFSIWWHQVANPQVKAQVRAIWSGKE